MHTSFLVDNPPITSMAISTIIAVLASLFYVIPVIRLWRQLLTRPDTLTTIARHKIWWGMLLLAVSMHGWQVYQAIYTADGLNVGFFSILSLVGWLSALLLFIASFTQPVACLGIMVYPLAATALLLRRFLAESHGLSMQLSAGLELHIMTSVLAYSLLSIAVVQAILLYFQDAHLHSKHPSGFIRALPALETMELLLFRIIGLGFLVLTISLLSGFFYLEDMFAQHLVHKTILSLLAWALFAILLWGRWQFGWRGRIAIRWTIGAFILLMLAYFGSKFVIEMILQR